MLEEHRVEFRFRDYRKEPLDRDELERLLELLGASPREVLRTRDRAYRELGLTGSESTSTLIKLMSEHPTLLQRPIGVLNDRALVGRPPERLLELAAPS